MSGDISPVRRLQLVEKQRTRFLFYGHRTVKGEPGGVYTKLAYSLNEALVDLMTNPEVLNDSGYLVNDLVVEMSDHGEPIVHVTLVSSGNIQPLPPPARPPREERVWPGR